MIGIRSIRWSIVCAIVAALFVVPVSISPAGSVELESVCASTECASRVSSYCWDQGQIYPDARPIMTELD